MRFHAVNSRGSCGLHALPCGLPGLHVAQIRAQLLRSALELRVDGDEIPPFRSHYSGGPGFVGRHVQADAYGLLGVKP